VGVRWGYVTTGVPPSTALTPVPARNASAYSYKGTTVGQPGTQGVPVGLPDFGQNGLQANGIRLRGGGAGYASGSDTMPLAWYPQLHYQSTLLAPGQASGYFGGASIWSDNQMPIPARDPLGKAAVLAIPPVFLGQRDIPQPPAGQPSTSWWARLAQATGFVGPRGGYGA
jgi:hypothetical protein